MLFQVHMPPEAHDLSGKWLGHELHFSPLPDKTGSYAIAGIPIETVAGSYDVLLDGVRGGKPFHYSRVVRVFPAQYPRVAVTVAKKFTEPSPDQLKAIAADKELKQSVFSKATELQSWQGDFKPPVTAPISGVYGTERVFNGQVQSRHLGTDYAVSAGTPVHAINAGTVVLAQQLYFEGGFIVIDHGQGLMSLYLHLSDFKVKQGDDIQAGQLIALSGGSGRATGPHLHLAVRWEGVYVDPAVLLDLKVPK